MSDDVLELRLSGARDAVASGAVTSTTLTEAALARADEAGGRPIQVQSPAGGEYQVKLVA